MTQRVSHSLYKCRVCCIEMDALSTRQTLVEHASLPLVYGALTELDPVGVLTHEEVREHCGGVVVRQLGVVDAQTV